MPSTQVTMVIETEKDAAQIEADARTKARNILAQAKETASINRQTIDKSTDVKIEDIIRSAHNQEALVIKEAGESASNMAAALQQNAEKHKSKAIQAAVNLLTGRS
jgi:vacuolar-type H+-ATPase subunit H